MLGQIVETAGGVAEGGKNRIIGRWGGGFWGGGGLRELAQFFKDVGGCFDQLGALFDQFVTAAGDRRMDGAGNGENFAALLASQTGSNQRTAFRRGFNDQHAS